MTEIGQFQKIVGGLIEMVDELAKEAEKEKMKVHMFYFKCRNWVRIMDLSWRVVYHLTGDRC